MTQPTNSNANETSDRPLLPDGLVAVVKHDCATCEMVVPVLQRIAAQQSLTVYTQDDPAFPPGIDRLVDDTGLDISWHHEIETVPTLMRVEKGRELSRIVGWLRPEWRAFTSIDDLGDDLPEMRPGCGSLSVDPSLADELNVRFTGSRLKSRRIEVAALEDEMELAFHRGWSDGLPVVPPTEARVLRMLEGTSRDPGDLVATIPPNLVEVTVEQVAINAVMAGCKPEYLPVVLTAVEAACTTDFNMHGLLATTFFAGPIIVVNGPITAKIGMNSGRNAFGQGNRANSTIGRAFQLVIRNLGGGRPIDGVDMAMLGSPGKLGFCFAEREHDSPFTPLSNERGIEPGVDSLTLFAGQGPTPAIDQLSRTPESLVRSLAAVLRATGHPKLSGSDAMLVIAPEHGRILSEAGWNRDRLRAELDALLTIDADTIVRGVDGITEGVPASMAGRRLPKFRPGGLLIAHAGGDAGLFSAILSGWVGGKIGSEPVSVTIDAWK